MYSGVFTILVAPLSYVTMSNISTIVPSPLKFQGLLSTPSAYLSHSVTATENNATNLEILLDAVDNRHNEAELKLIISYQYSSPIVLEAIDSALPGLIKILIYLTN
jgi:hypothetical protein